MTNAIREGGRMSISIKKEEWSTRRQTLDEELECIRVVQEMCLHYQHEEENCNLCPLNTTMCNCTPDQWEMDKVEKEVEEIREKGYRK